MDTFGWTDIEDIALALLEAHPQVDPTGVRFDRLRALIESLDGFEPETGHNVNEQILEAVQAAWIDETEDDPHGDKTDPAGYQPNDPFR